MSNETSSRGTFFDDLKPSDVMQLDVFANPSPAHRQMAATAFENAGASASMNLTEKQGSISIKTKKGFKIDPETGEEVPLNEDELRIQKLEDKLEEQKRRMTDLEIRGKIFPISYVASESEHDEADVSSDDSMLITPREPGEATLQQTSVEASGLQTSSQDIELTGASLQIDLSGLPEPVNDYVEAIQIQEHNQPEEGQPSQQVPLIDTGVMDRAPTEQAEEGEDEEVLIKKGTLLTGKMVDAAGEAVDHALDGLFGDADQQKGRTQINVQQVSYSDQQASRGNLDAKGGSFKRALADIPYFKNVPIPVQSQLYALSKSRKEKTEQDVVKLRNSLRNLDFFKSKQLDEKTEKQIITSASYDYVPKGKWVFKEGDQGDKMYLVLHGQCQVLQFNKEFLLFRRSMRERVKELLDLVDDQLEHEKNQPDNSNIEKYEQWLTMLLKVQTKIMKMRKQLQADKIALKKIKKYSKIEEYKAGSSFGDLALIYDSVRAASILATRHTFFLVIFKEDYTNHLKRAEKKQKEQVVEFFKNVPFLRGLSNQTIVKMEYYFKPHTMERAGKVVLQEGDPVTHLALVKDGEFEVVKRNLKNLDERLMSFLRKGDVRKRIAKQVMLLPGRTSIYQKTNQLYPPHEKSYNDGFLRDKSIDVEQLAFNSVSDQLYKIASQLLEKQSAGSTSLNSIKTSKVDQYKDIRISINGTGFVFGDFEAYLNYPTYHYSLRANHAGATCYLIEKKDFMKFVRQYGALAEEVQRSVPQKEMQLLKQLTRVVFSRWYTDVLQENLKVVPDLDSSYQKGKKGNKDQSNDYTETQSSPKPGSRSRSPSVYTKKAPIGLHKPSAEEIIHRSGTKRDIQMLQFREQDQMRMTQERERSVDEQRASVEHQRQARDLDEDKPKEKLQSQLNTLMPMEIVRAQPFFSRHSHILRDQIEEYVHGFPATKAHRQIIAKAYNMHAYELDKSGEQVPVAISPKEEAAQKESSRKTRKDQIDMLIPDQDLPVDPERLKKAIKTALIKNDNNPDKIDIQSIMREQVRIHKHIQEYKQSKSKQSPSAGVTGQYFSSRIVKKIAEDHIHQSLKQIFVASQSSTSGFQMPQKLASQSKSVERLQQSPTKFQKLLASKFNQGFTSVYKTQSGTGFNEKLLNKSTMSKDNRPSSVRTLQIEQQSQSQVTDLKIKDGHQSIDEPEVAGTLTPKEGQAQFQKHNGSESGEHQMDHLANRSFNHISHKKIGPIKPGLEVSHAEIKAQYYQGNSPVQDSLPVTGNNQLRSSSNTANVLNSSSETPHYTFFSNKQIIMSSKQQAKHTWGSPAYKGDAFLYKSKQYLNNYAQIANRQKRSDLVSLPFANPQIQQTMPSIHSRRQESLGRNLSIKDGLLNKVQISSTFVRKGSSIGDSRMIGNHSMDKMHKQSRSSSNHRIKLAALFQPKDVRRKMQNSRPLARDSTNYTDVGMGQQSIMSHASAGQQHHQVPLKKATRAH